MIEYLKCYLEGTWAKALPGKETVAIHVSLKKRIFGHFFCGCDYSWFCLCSNMILEWSGNLFMFNRITLWPSWESQTSSQIPGAFFLALTLCVKKAVPVLKELPQGEVCANKLHHSVVCVITETLKANSANYYLADIQILFQTYHKGTISLRVSSGWENFFSLFQ